LLEGGGKQKIKYCKGGHNFISTFLTIVKELNIMMIMQIRQGQGGGPLNKNCSQLGDHVFFPEKVAKTTRGGCSIFND